MEIIFQKTSLSIKNPERLKRNVFIVYSPRTVKTEPAACSRIDTELVLILPKNSKAFIISIFRGDEIDEFCSEKQRLWVEIWNKSFRESIEIKKSQPLGFVFIEPEHLNFKYETTTTSKKKKKAISKTKKFKQKTLPTAWRIS